MDNQLIALLLLICIIYLSRAFIGISNKKLDQAKKAELIDLFSKDRFYTLGFLIIIIVLYIACLKFNWFDPFMVRVTYAVLLLGYIITINFLSFRKLKNNHFPDFYIKSYLLTTTLRISGYIMFVIIVEF